MNEKSRDSSILYLVFFVIVVTIVYSTQNMLSPNLERISYFFGFEGDTAQLGFLTFSYTILAGISIAIFGYLADKITRKWLLFFGTLIFSIFAILTIFVPSGLSGYFLFFFLTAMNGIGFGMIVPSIFSLIGDIVSQDDRSKGYSFFSIASLLGGAIGLVLATAVGSIDWRISYFFAGIMGLVGTSLVLFFHEPSRIGKDYSHLLEEDAIDYTYRIKISDLKVIFKKKSNIWLVVNFVDTIPTGIILFLLFYYMSDYHNIPEGLALIFLILILISTLFGTVIFGFIGDSLFKKGKKRARALLAVIGNIVPIPFAYIALIIPFKVPDNATIGDLFLIPAAAIMIVFLMIGLFVNGAVNGNWYSCVVDLNLPEHRGTILATANFFDIIGRAIGPLIGALIADAYGLVYGMMISILFWVFIPLFWIPVLRNLIPEMEATERIFKERLGLLSKNN